VQLVVVPLSHSEVGWWQLGVRDFGRGTLNVLAIKNTADLVKNCMMCLGGMDGLLLQEGGCANMAVVGISVLWVVSVLCRGNRWGVLFRRRSVGYVSLTHGCYYV
jgi:hypothetical protein